MLSQLRNNVAVRPMGARSSSSAVPCARPRIQPCVRCRVAAPDSEEGTTTTAAPAPTGVHTAVKEGWDKFVRRYEHSLLSSGVGAAAVTTWCVLHGQSPGEAAVITVVSTITALVLNELLFSDNQPSS